MKIKIKLFAALRDAAGREEVGLEWRQNMTPADLMIELGKNFASVAPLLKHSFVAVNGCYAEPGAALMPDDEVAVLPPVSGG